MFIWFVEEKGYERSEAPDDVTVQFSPYLREILKVKNKNQNIELFQISDSDFSITAKYSFVCQWCDSRLSFEDLNLTFKEVGQYIQG